MFPNPALSALFDRLPNVVLFAKGGQGRYRQVNTTQIVRCGKRHGEEILGHTAAGLFPGALGAAYSAQDRQALRTGVAIEDKLERHAYAGGQEGWCLTYQTVIGHVGISRDAGSSLSERVRLDRLRRSGLGEPNVRC